MTVNQEQQQIKSSIPNYESYLEQKVGNIFSSWKNNYYICLEGLVFIYTNNKDSKEVIGHIPISNISNVSSLNNSTFQFNSDDKTYIFRVINVEEKEKWMNVLSKIISEKEEQNKDNKERNGSLVSDDTHLLTKNKKEITTSPGKTNKNNEKLCSIGKKEARIIKYYGYTLNPEDQISEEILIDKRIQNLINIKDPKIKTRIHHGFMYKKHKAHDYFQKRWFFIFSSRPLFDKEYIQDDIDLDKKKQKDWLKFDTLYYFKFKNRGENRENLGGLEMVNSHKIIHFEEDEKYFLNLDVGERVYDFYCDNKYDRDEWFEVLKNSRRTAKEYFLSKTKKPRNIDKLNIFFLKGEKDFIKKMENEKKNVIGNEEDILEYDVFEFNQNNFKELILSTIDGCLSNTPVKKDLMKSYTEYMTKEYLEATESFWKRFYNKMQHADILRMSMLLLTFRDELLLLNVDDENLYKNGKELIKIYYKKTYQNILSSIENILKSERELKGIKSETGELYTQGPTDLFALLSNTFDLVKENRNKCVYVEILVLFKESIKQYIMGIDAVLVNLDIIVDNQYLIAVANNSFNIINLLNDLIDDMKKMNVLTETEINQNLQNNKLMYTINKISQYAISNFVSHFRVELGSEFKNIYFVDLNMEKILVRTMEIFGTYKSMMSVLVVKKTWNEILKLTIYHYICCLLTTVNKKQKPVEELKEKVEYDTGLLKETYTPVVGPNLTNSTIKIMNDIVDFFDVRSYMISSSCLTFRQYIGKSFTIQTMKYLIKLRSDFSPQERDEAIEQCKDLLLNYQEQNDANTGGYFQYMEKELKKQEREEKRQEKLLKLSQMTNNNKKAINQSFGRDSLLHSKTINNFYNPENGEGIESESESISEEKEEPENGEVIDLEDLLKEDSEDEEENDAKKNDEIDKIELNVVESVEYKEISDIEHEGFMYKKSHSTYKKRFFQLKNGYLYWYLDKKSSIIQNKISIKDTEKVESHKSLKFLMRVKEEEEKTKIMSTKEYKFKCETEEEKVAWIFAITNSMKKVKNSAVSKNETKLNIKVRKKLIHDLFKFPDINKNLAYMREKVLKSMEKENYFQPSQRKIEADRKKAIEAEEERKRKEKEEIERKKREEKEERERKKREEKERKKREEEERDRQIERDIKEGKDVGVKNRIKFWFKGLGKGKDNKDEKITENEEKSINSNIKEIKEDNQEKINNYNLDDFISDDEDEEKKENSKIKNNKDEEKENKLDNKNEESENENKINEIKLEDFASVEEVEMKEEIEKENKEKKINEILNKDNNISLNDENENIHNNIIINNKNNNKEKNMEVNSKMKETENDNQNGSNIENDEIKEKNHTSIKDNETENINKIKFDYDSSEEEKESDDEIERQIKDLENKNINKDEQEEVIKANFEEGVGDIDKKIIQTESSNRNNSNYNVDKEKKPEEKKKEKKGFFANLFSCNSTNEERNERKKKKKEKNEQELIEDEIKKLKKEQDDIKKQKKLLEIENQKNKETQERLNKKKLTKIEEKSRDEEEDKKEEDIKEEYIKVIKEEKNEDKEIKIKEENKEENKEEKKEIKGVENPKENINEIKDNNSNIDNINNSLVNESSQEVNNTQEDKKEQIKPKEEEKEDEVKNEKEKQKSELVKEKEDNDFFDDINNIKILKKKKRKKTHKRASFIDEEDKISEKSNESDDDEKNIEKNTLTTNKEEDTETKSNNIFKTTNYAKHNNSQYMDESLFKDKKSLNRYSDNGTINFSNIENNSEESSNNIVNFLGLSKETGTTKNILSNNNNVEDEEDEREYLNKKINKKMIKNKEDIIEIIPEKKEEEDDSEEHRESRLAIKKFTPRNSSVQFAQAKNLSHRTSIALRLSSNKSQFSDLISPILVDKTVTAEKIIKAINNKDNRDKIDEKIKKIRDEIPDIKTKYEIYMEEEKKKNGGKSLIEEEYEKEEENKENEEPVNDWFEGIF